ncbi:MAG: tetratricopeptide repeat protein [Bacteroidales bacterium]|nr:tetratricopeptide repeat protein [Bacteroidales bacterium]
MKRVIVILLLLVSIAGFAQEDIRKNATYFSKGLECKYKEDVSGAIKNFEDALRFMPDDAASMFELSEQYVKAGKMEEGFEMIKQAAQLDPENKWYQMRLAMFYRTLEQFDDYIKVFEGLTAKYPGDVDMLSNLIEAYLITENYDKAIEKLDILEQQAGVSALVSEQKVEIYQRQGNTKKVISELEKLISENPENTRYYSMLAKVYMENKKEKEAVKLYNRIKEIDSSDPYINISLLEYYENKKEYDKAFDELIEAINNKNLDFNTKANIYEYWFNKHQDAKDIDQQALRAGNAFLVNYPDNKMGYLVMASYHINKQEYQPCSVMAQKALDYDHTNYAAWQYLVICDGALRANDSLKKHSVEALQFYPTQPIFYWYAGVSHALDKQEAEAISYFEKGRKFVTDKNALMDFDSYLGDLYHSVGETEKAFQAYDRVLNQDPDNVLVLNNYAYYLSLRKEDLDKAKAMALHAVELEPNNAIYLDTYAWVLYQKGEYKAAEAQMEKAVKLLKSPDKTYYQHYADILDKVNKPEKAAEYRNKANAL